MNFVLMRARFVGDADRAQTATVGIVLVFGVMLMGASIVVVFGIGAIDDSQQTLSVERAEKALTQLDSRAALVALGASDTQTVDFARAAGDQFRVENGTGWMNVTIRNTTTPGSPDHLVNQSLGSVVYENEDDVIAYQGGGVWRSTADGGSLMVSPPEFHFRNGTLTLPVVNLTGDVSLGSGASITHSETIRRFPDRSAADRHNPLDQHRVELVVQSDHYQAWGNYFEERTDGIVEYDHDEDKVFLQLVSPLGKKKVSAALSSQASIGTFTIQGSSGDPCGIGGLDTPYANSYDSSGTDDGYCDQHLAGLTGSAGNISYGEDVDISSGAGGDDIDGDIRAGGAVWVPGGPGSGQPRVDGDIFWTDVCNPSPSQCDVRSTGGEAQISGTSTTGNVDFLIDNRVSDFAESNDNGDPGVPISGNQLDFGAGSTATIDQPGAYLLDDIDLGGGETLELDTSSGDISIAVRDFVEVTGGGTIHVHGDNAAKVYVGGENPIPVAGEDHMLHLDGGSVDVQHDDSPEFRLYGTSDFNATVRDGVFTGVLYAPPGAAGNGSLTLNDGGAIFGGAIVGDTTIPTGGGQGGSVHYDEALRDTQIISRSAKVVKVTYLHVTVNRIHVASG